MTRRQLCEEIVKDRIHKAYLKESEQESIEDIVLGYSSWSGTDMKPAIANCAQDLKAAGYTAQQVQDYFDADGYWTEDDQDGVWDPDFAEGVVASLRHLTEDEDDFDDDYDFEGEDDEDDFDKSFSEEDAVADAFPMASPHTVETIAQWYRNEGAIDDFDTLQEFSEHISDDFLDMFWAGDYDNDEFHEVAQDMINVGYYDADRFPYGDEDADFEE